MDLTYFGTAMLLAELPAAPGSGPGARPLRLLTDPVLDPEGTRYDFGPWYAPRAWFSSQKTYRTPVTAADLGALDAVLLSHDHHADNLDHEGRRLLASGAVARVVAPRESAARLARPGTERSHEPGEGLGIAAKLTGLAWGERTRIGDATTGIDVTATPARHGPHGTPRIHEVAGFLLEPTRGPVTWISGDTVLFPALRRFAQDHRAAGRRIDVAVVHCGGVRFPAVPLLGRSLFTFDAAQVVEICRLLAPRVIVPVHRAGWSHFRQPESELRRALDEAGLGTRTRFLELGERTTLTSEL